MFARMLRPSRRHAHDHERIPQQEDNDDSNNDSDDIGNAANGNRNAAVNQMQSDQAYRTTSTGQPGEGEDGLAAIGSNHDPLAEVPAGGGVDEEEPQSTAANRNIGDNNELSPVAREHQNSAVDETVEAEEEAGIVVPNPTTHPFLTSQIQTERQLRYRRQSTCTLLILFFLIRLWIEAILKKDLGMIFISLTLSTWTYRWFMCRRETEAEFDRQIVENSNRDAVSNDTTGRAALGPGAGVDLAVAFDPDLGLMSFQAQMALAILESQRQMLNGGYGNSSSADDDGPGVTKEATEQWKRYTWGIEPAEEAHTLAEKMTRSSSSAAIKRSTSNDYGSLSSDESLEKNASPETLEEGGPLKQCAGAEEAPCCSICLCEYERGEQVLCLPCDHVFHEACLASWTDSHVRCPLCNLDLMDGYDQPPRVRRAQQHAEEQRAFRTMALSTLGRRIRTSRRAASRRASRRAAAEDSIV